MHYRLPAAFAALAVLSSSAFALAQSPAPAMSPGAMAAPAMSAGKPLTFKLAAQNGSGESGTAVLTQAGPDVTVVLTLTGGNSAGPQPVHIHEGTCAKLNPKPKYPLSAVVGGKSMTTLKDLKLADLETGGFAINAHQDTTPEGIAKYVACGDIPAMGKM